MNAPSFEEGTVFKVGAPARVERIGPWPYPHMPPNGGICRIKQPSYLRFSVLLRPAGVTREYAAIPD
jgi:hypothetical protein